MQDRFQFRAWNKKKKEWVDPNIIGMILNGRILVPNEEVFLEHDPGDLILVQGTGLKDQNGKDIFEGDIVEIDYFKKGGGAFPDKYKDKVTYENGGFVVGDISFIEIMKNNDLATKGEKLPMSVEVLGNIYEHKHLYPELFEKEKL